MEYGVMSPVVETDLETVKYVWLSHRCDLHTSAAYARIAGMSEVWAGADTAWSTLQFEKMQYAPSYLKIVW